MTSLTDCPSLPDLMRLLTGEEVPPDEVERLGRHLTGCGSCLRALESLGAGDSLIRRLEGWGSDGRPPTSEALASVLRQLRELYATRTESPPSQSPTVAAVEARGGLDQAELASLLQPPLGPTELGRLGHYRILRLLGTGGMGVVFQAEDTQLGRLVALKVMRPGAKSGGASRERFLREARAAAVLRDDRVVTIYQVGQAGDVPFIAMEYLEGEALEARLRREGRLPLAEVLRIGRQVATALATAHEAGLVHRDVKPGNIWLQQRPGEEQGRVKLLDFGLVRAADQQISLTSTGQFVGTPRYAAPEQARGEEVDARADLFSLGCVLYRMAVGVEAFRGGSLMAVLTAVAVDNPLPMSERDSSLPPALVELVQRLLAKGPAGRPASAREVAGSLRAIEQGETALSPSAAPSDVESLPSRALPTDDVPTGDEPEPTSRSIKPPRRLRPWLLTSAGAAVALAALLLVWWVPWRAGRPAGPPIRVGVLHSTSGTLAQSGTALVDATMLAIEEVNEAGGVLGRKVEAVFRDGRSTPDVYAQEAEALIRDEQVSAIFGCWTSASRKHVKEVVEKFDHLLIYSIGYEGLEQSPNIVYNGATPNQQIIPAVRHCFTALGARRFFLVGSDYVFPRTANEVIRQEVAALGGTIVGEEYRPLGDTDFGDIVKKVVEAKPDMILNTIDGDSNRAFFRALRAAGITPERVPTLSFSISEQELRGLDPKDVAGDYAARNYFQSLQRRENAAFVKRFQARYGAHRVTSDSVEAAYFGVHLWARAVERAGSDDPRAVRVAIKGLRFDAPEGQVRIDPDTLHTWKYFRLGRVVEGGQFEIVWSNDLPMRPEPFPPSRKRAEWEQFLKGLHDRWGGRWAAP